MNYSRLHEHNLVSIFSICKYIVQHTQLSPLILPLYNVTAFLYYTDNFMIAIINPRSHY